jgi:Lon protease-like protein
MSDRPESDFPDTTGVMILPWTCLFPGAMLPLHIFEERYRVMCKLALAGNRMFAIAHATDDETIADIGSLGVIRAAVTNGDGTSNLILQGIGRVAFGSVTMDPYPQATLSILSESEEEDDKLASLRRKIRDVSLDFFAKNTEALHYLKKHLSATASDSTFIDMIAAIHPFPQAQRSLLEELDIKTRMQLLLHLLQSENSDA